MAQHTYTLFRSGLGSLMVFLQVLWLQLTYNVYMRSTRMAAGRHAFKPSLHCGLMRLAMVAASLWCCQ
jgi:hypothetical protein